MRVDDDHTRRATRHQLDMGVSLLDRHEADHPDYRCPAGRTALRCDLTLVFEARRQFEPLIKAARDLILAGRLSPRLARGQRRIVQLA